MRVTVTLLALFVLAAGPAAANARHPHHAHQAASHHGKSDGAASGGKSSDATGFGSSGSKASSFNFASAGSSKGDAYGAKSHRPRDANAPHRGKKSSGFSS